LKSKRTNTKMPKRTFRRRKTFKKRKLPTFTRQTRQRFGRVMENKMGSTYETENVFPWPINGVHRFPMGYRFTHKYVHNFPMSTGTGVMGTQQVMRMNSPYDPDYTSGGHQASTFDTFITLYDNYRVDKCFWKITFNTPGANNDILCLATVAPSTTGSLTAANINYPQERDDCISGQLSPAGNRRCVLHGSFDLNLIVGKPRMQYQADNLYASPNSTNPSQDILLTFAIGCYDGTSGVSCAATVEIWYDTWWYGRRDLPAS
jgi:hypothetical protein